MENVQLVQLVIVGVALFVVLWLLIDYFISRKKKQRITNKNVKQMSTERPNTTYRSTQKQPPHTPTNNKHTSKNVHPNIKENSETASSVKQTPRDTAHKQQKTHASTDAKVAKKHRTVDLQQFGVHSGAEKGKSSRPAPSPMSTARQAAVKLKDYKERLPQDYKKEDLVVVFVKASGREFFEGNKIRAFFSKHDVLAGHKQIFHRHQQDDTGAWRLVFSVANGTGNGVLKEVDLPDFKTRSLVFITWTRSHKPLRYFDDMMHTANQLAQELGGRLYAVNKEVWTEQTTNRTREFIRARLAQFHKERTQKTTH